MSDNVLKSQYVLAAFRTFAKAADGARVATWHLNLVLYETMREEIERRAARLRSPHPFWPKRPRRTRP